MTTKNNHSASERAYSELRKLILMGRIEPGAVLSEAQLQKLVKHTRTPVRTAILALQAEGLVEVEPKKGTLVPSVTVNELRALLALRLAVEIPTACALFEKTQVMRGLTAPLREIVATMRQLAKRTRLTDQQIMQMIDLDIGFHAKIAQLADYQPAIPALRRWHHRILIAIPSTWRPDQISAVVAEHVTLIDAIEQGPGDRVGRAVKDHMVGGARRYFPGLEQFVDRDFPTMLRAGVR